MFLRQIKNKFFIFKKNKRCKIFISDQNYSRIPFDKYYKTFYFDRNCINLYYTLSTFIEFFLSEKKLNLKDSYISAIIKSVKPKIVISNEISERGFRIKEMFPKVKLIIYQLGHYFPISQKVFVKNLERKKCDYFLVFNREIKKILHKMKTKFLITGSIKNNSRTKKNSKKIYDLMFISEFRKLDPESRNKYLINKKNFHDDYNSEYYGNVHASRILEYLNEYCKKYKKKLVIGKSASRKDKVNKISSFDEDIFHNYYAPTHITNKQIDSESLAEKSKVIICMTSNLGLELASKGHRVIFLNLNYLTYNWFFFQKKKEKKFWEKHLDKNKLSNKINKLINMSEIKYKNIFMKNQKLIFYDKNNTKLFKLINTILKNG